MKHGALVQPGSTIHLYGWGLRTPQTSCRDSLNPVLDYESHYCTKACFWSNETLRVLALDGLNAINKAFSSPEPALHFYVDHSTATLGMLEVPRAASYFPRLPLHEFCGSR